MVDKKFIILSAIGVAIGVGIGVIIGYFGRGAPVLPPDPPKADPNANKILLDEISNMKIEENLKILTENPHIAGRRVDEVDLVKFVSDSFKDAGLTVEVHPYEVLLSYPEDSDSNYLAIKLEDGTLVNKSQPKEQILDQSQNKSGVVNPFNAYSKSGDPEGDLVYVNYGTIDDFIEIDKKINLTGKICIARYGAIFRGDKAAHAEQYNCSGLILYSDPKDYTVVGRKVYPDDWFLPGTGAQRDTAWRMKEGDAGLPKIPVTPIGYDDACVYLSKMGGDEVPEKWRGGLNITYRYGPGFTGDFKNSKMRMHVTTTNQREITHNVFGYIKGFVEPDRYVIIGNHRDAWVFGAMDPSSGTAAMLEVARAFGAAVKKGWKPRRTIIFCSWGAEEYMLIGSTEWIEEFQKVLGSRTVAYLNADTVVSGNHTIIIKGSSSLKNVIFDATKLVPNPNPTEVAAGRTNAYDTWYKVSGKKEPSIASLGSGSDYSMFLQLTGISCLDINYARDPGLGTASYPVYHSVYETFDLVKKFVDCEFKYHQSAARITAEMARNLADSPLLPFDIKDYVAKMTTDMRTMLNNSGESLRNDGKINTDDLVSAMTNLSDSANAFHDRLSNLDTTDTLALRAANDQLMFFERAFIDKNRIEGREKYSHVIYAPSFHDAYGGAAFPGLVDSMFGIGDATDSRWENVRKQFAILLYHIGSAASTLEEVVPIRGYSNKHSGYKFN